MLETLDTNSFLAALQRFTARRPRPKTIQTDQGGNFVRGQKLLDLARSQVQKEEVRKNYPDINWIFTAAYAPHTNGLVERAIQSAKRAIAAIIPPAKLRDEDLATIFTVTEGLLNSRPISLLSADPMDLQALTPGHFLIGDKFRDIAPPPNEETWNVGKRWRYIQTLIDQFWRRFLKELIPQMSALNKWTRKSEDLKIGDIVALLEDKGERGKWPLAIVTDVCPNPKDKRVRTVVLLCKGKILKRHINRLMLLLSTDVPQPISN
jgi:hypothetical protein